MPRYVILRHVLPASDPRGLHWDLMLEHEQVLKTWALPTEPAPQAALTAERLPDHRLHYLDYEGPIAGDRGVVTRWDAGEYTVQEVREDCWRVVLLGARLHSQLLLQRNATDQRWTVELRPA